MAKNMNVPAVKPQSLSAYDPHQNAALYNRMGQYYYLTGEVDWAKACFFLSKLYDGTFQIDPSLYRKAGQQLN